VVKVKTMKKIKSRYMKKRKFLKLLSISIMTKLTLLPERY
jgi:hypothetical protein